MEGEFFRLAIESNDSAEMLDLLVSYVAKKHPEDSNNYHNARGEMIGVLNRNTYGAPSKEIGDVIDKYIGWINNVTTSTLPEPQGLQEEQKHQEIRGDINEVESSDLSTE